MRFDVIAMAVAMAVSAAGCIPGVMEPAGEDETLTPDTEQVCASKDRQQGPETPYFTGIVRDQGYDTDGNGLYEYLMVAVEICASEATSVGLVSTLESEDERLIGLGSVVPDIARQSPGMHTDLEEGWQVIPIYFNGAAIRSSGANGPYSVGFQLLVGENSDVTHTMNYMTGPYQAVEFQGLLASVAEIHDTGIDRDEWPGYEFLQVDVEIEMLAKGTLELTGQLFAGETFLGDARRTDGLAAGIHSLSLEFPGQPIAISGQEGPYTVYLTWADGNYTDNIEYRTSSLDPNSFQNADAFFCGETEDRLLDEDRDGLWEELAVSTIVCPVIPGVYTLHGILEIPDRAFLGAKEVTFPIMVHRTPAEVRFAAGDLNLRENQGELAGSWRVTLALTTLDGVDLVGIEHWTQPINPEQADLELP